MSRRYMKFSAFIVGTLLMASDLSFAQNQTEQRDQPRQGGRGMFGGGRGFRGGPPGFDINELYDRVAKDLQFDESQMAQLEEIKTEQRQRMENFRQRMDAIREAEESGDDTKAQQLRDEFRQEREQDSRGPGRFDPLSAIEPILTDAQREQLPTVRETIRTEREEQMRKRFEDRYTQIAEDLQLDDSQRATLDQIKANQLQQMEDFRNRWREVRQAYDSGNSALGDQLREQMMTEMRENGGPQAFMNRVFDDLDPVLTDEQRERAAEMREEGPGFGGGRQGGRGRAGEGSRQRDAEEAENLSPEALPKSLGLTPDQQASFASMLSSHKQQTAGLQSQIDRVREQIAVASRGGDTSNLEQLNAQLVGLEGQLAQADEAFYDQVGSILTPDQQAQLADLRAENQSARDLNGAPADLRAVIRAASRLKLDAVQKQQLRQIISGVKDDIRQARETDRRGRDRERTAEKALGASYKARIKSLLTAEQSEKYDTMIERLTPKTRRSSRREI